MIIKEPLKSPCWCCSGKPADQCCMPCLSGTKHAKTPLALMRSRYSAYVLGGYGAYLVETWLPVLQSGLDLHDLSNRSTKWIKLEVLHKSQRSDQGWIEFNATYLDEHARECIHHEKSLFQRLEGRWYYVNGDVETY